MSRGLLRYFDQERERLNLKLAEHVALNLRSSADATTAALADLEKQRDQAEQDD